MILKEKAKDFLRNVFSLFKIALKNQSFGISSAINNQAKISVVKMKIAD